MSNFENVLYIFMITVEGRVEILVKILRKFIAYAVLHVLSYSG